LLESVEVIVSKYKQALIQNNFLCFLASSIQDEAGSITSRNGCGHIDQVSFLKIDSHVERDGFGFFRCSGFRAQ
jgi:hypothetical protein